jgi:peptidyl-prolyl cis-trans isomerase C
MQKLNINIFMTLLLLSLSFKAIAADNVAITVNGKPIKQTTLDYLFKDANERGQKIDDTQKEAVIARLVSNELIYQEALKAGLDKKSDFQIQEDLARRELLVNAYWQDYMKNNPISESDIKAAYEKYKIELGNKEYKVSHILLESEAEAIQVIGQLNKGGDFAKIAADKSRDPSAKENKGELGWFSLASILKPFNLVLPYLNKGAISKEPIQTKFGWHVIRLEDTRDITTPEYDKVKDALQKQLSKRQMEKMLLELRNKAVVVDNNNKSKKWFSN